METSTTNTWDNQCSEFFSYAYIMAKCHEGIQVPLSCIHIGTTIVLDSHCHKFLLESFLKNHHIPISSSMPLLGIVEHDCDKKYKYKYK